MKLVLAAFAMLLPIAASAQGTDSVAGAWEQVSSKNLKTGDMQKTQGPPLHVIFSDGHYVQFRAEANRAKSPALRTDMTKEQLLERGDIQGQYGTYRVVGNRLTRKITSAADPNNEGRETVVDFRIEGDTLITTSAGGSGQGGPTETRYRKLRPTS